MKVINCLQIFVVCRGSYILKADKKIIFNEQTINLFDNYKCANIQKIIIPRPTCRLQGRYTKPKFEYCVSEYFLHHLVAFNISDSQYNTFLFLVPSTQTRQSRLERSIRAGNHFFVPTYIVNWRINKLLLPHNLYSSAKHIPLLSQKAFVLLVYISF